MSRLTNAERHRLYCEYADLALAALSDEEVLEHCPPSWGTEVGEAHFIQVWDDFYTVAALFPEEEIYREVVRMQRALTA